MQNFYKIIILMLTFFALVLFYVVVQDANEMQRINQQYETDNLTYGVTK